MIKINQLGHSMAERLLFNNLSFTLDTQKTGLVGPNGSGKTTLALLLAGRLVPERGSIQAQGQVQYLSQAELAPRELTVAEYLVDVWDTPEDSVMGLIQGLDFERRLAYLSGGEWMRVRLAKMISAPTEFLILDEPTNNLDLEGRRHVREFIRHYVGGLLVISHDRELLREMEQILELSNQGITTYGGNFDFYWSERDKERSRSLARVETAKREAKKTKTERLEKLSSQEKRMREGALHAPKSGLPKILLGARKRAAQVSHAKLKKQEDDFVDQADQDLGEELQSQKQDPFLRLDFQAGAVAASKVLFQVVDLNFRFRNSDFELWKTPVHFLLKGGQRLRISGANGSGKSTLLKILLDRAQVLGSVQGQVSRHGVSAYLDQSYSLLNPQLSVLENILESKSWDVIQLRNELAFYGFRGDQALQKVATLSGGEILKAALAKLFLGGPMPQVLILDEPTNNLDLQSVELLKKALKFFKGAVIVVSHDGEFISDLGITDEVEMKG